MAISGLEALIIALVTTIIALPVGYAIGQVNTPAGAKDIVVLVVTLVVVYVWAAANLAAVRGEFAVPIALHAIAGGAIGTLLGFRANVFGFQPPPADDEREKHDPYLSDDDDE